MNDGKIIKPQVRLREVPKTMLHVPPSSIAATDKACASLSLPQPMAASSTSFKGEDTAEPVSPSGQHSTRGKRPRGIFQNEALTLAEMWLIAAAARSSCVTPSPPTRPAGRP